MDSGALSFPGQTSVFFEDVKYDLADSVKGIQQGIPNSSLHVHTRGHRLTWVADRVGCTEGPPWSGEQGPG